MAPSYSDVAAKRIDIRAIMGSDSLPHPLPAVGGMRTATNPTPTNHSPLHQSFPASSSPQMAPSHTPSPEPKTRGRGLSRSSSVPVSLRDNAGTETTTNGSAPDSSKRGTGSVKHLTCFWWKEKRNCRYSDDECLYAHYDTGKYADPPRQLVPGQPAMAGRNLDRQLSSLKHLTGSAHRSSPSLSSLGRSRSRPSTPNGHAFSSSTRASTPSPQHEHSLLDSTLLHNLLNQSIQEKAVMISTIRRLEAESAALESRIEAIEQDKNRLNEQCDHFRNTVCQLRYENLQRSNGLGAIGSQRDSSNTHRVVQTTEYTAYNHAGRQLSPPDASEGYNDDASISQYYPVTHKRGHS